MKIKYKLFAFIISIITIGIVLTSYLSLSLFKKNVIAVEKQNFSTLLRVFAYSCKLDIDRFVEALGDDSSILYAMVLSSDGEVLVHSERGMEGKQLNDPVSMNAMTSDSVRFADIDYNGKKGIDASMPISLEKIKWAIVRIGFSTQRIDEDINEARKLIFMLACIITFFGVIFAYVLSRKIVKPIEDLTEKAEQIAVGNRNVEFDFPVIKYPECKEILNCKEKDCPALDEGKNIKQCKDIDKTVDNRLPFMGLCNGCETCDVFKKHMKNEVNRLVETFKMMYDAIKLKEEELIKDEMKITRVNVELQDTLKKLMDSEAKYKTLTESARDMIFTLDLKGKFTFVNKKANEILDLSDNAKLSGRSFTRILTRESRRKAYEIFKKIVEGEETKAFEVTALKGASDSISLGLILSPIIEEGVLVGIHGIARDISYRKSLEAQLIQTGRLSSIGELATGIAHELNQPLMIIRGYSQLINSDLQKGDRFYDELMLLEKHTGRMAKIIGHLQAFAKQDIPDFTYVNVNDIINSSLFMISEHLKLKNIEVSKKLKEDLPFIYGDFNQLEQVFLNLITNARDAIEKKGGGVLEFKTDVSDDADHVVVSVSDTGCGISDEDLENIFNPFFTTKDVGKGTGLGLSISYGIIQAHKGTITVDSRKDIGTVFKIKLPVFKEKHG